jgi:hypothetical protein
MIDIVFKYKLQQAEKWIFLPITQNEYVDFNYVEEGEEILIDNALPLYDDDEKYYLPEEIRDKVIAMQIEITERGSEKRELKTTYYWNEQKDFVCEVIRIDGESFEKEIIISTQSFEINKNEKQYLSQTTRFIEVCDVLQPCLHSIFILDKDGIDIDWQNTTIGEYIVSF